MKRFIRVFLIVLFTLVGIGLLLYPTVANWINETHATKIQATYDTSVDDMNQEQIDEMWHGAEEYNDFLRAKLDQYSFTDADHDYYFDTLDVTGTGVMCAVDIPTLGVKLPVYHSTDQTVLSTSVGHMEGSSLPVGGKGTNTVFTAHRGLPSAKLFTSLDTMKVGDTFYVETLGQTLAYEVKDIWVVLPDEFEHLRLDPDRDLVTLVTCTPYSVNTHRLLVQGERVGDGQNMITFENNREHVRRFHILYLVEYGGLGAAVLLLCPMTLVLFRKHKKVNEADEDTKAVRLEPKPGEKRVPEAKVIPKKPKVKKKKKAEPKIKAAALRR